MDRPFDILDCTLRDGSYCIDFQFTAEDTALLCSALDSAGIGWIEIGHGLGLGAADETGQGASDAEYIAAARAAVRNGRVGAFFIPGIGTEDDIRAAADGGLDFIRVGTNITEHERQLPTIKLARELGLEVSCNLMKSYAVSPEVFAETASTLADAGANLVCLVDSAGGMLPEDMHAYIGAAKARTEVDLGFHGHDNLSMAVANSLAAIDAGARIVDSSLMGMGRSEGNAVTEVLVAILQRRGALDDIDLNGLLDVAGAFITPMLHEPRRTSLGITAGRAKFHSSFFNRVMSAAEERGIDVRELIMRLCQVDTVNAPDALVQKLASEIAAERPRGKVRIDIAATSAQQPSNFIESVSQRARELKQLGAKLGKPTVFNVVVSPYEMTHVSPYVETRFGCAMTNVMIAEPARLDETLAAIDGEAQYVLGDFADASAPALNASIVLQYNDHAMWSRAVVSHLSTLLGDVRNKKILLTGIPPLVSRVARELEEAGSQCTIDDAPDVAKLMVDAFAASDAVVSLSPRHPRIQAEHVSHMKEGALLYDGGIGSIARDAVPAAEARSIRVVRVDMRPSLASEALERIATHQLVHDHMGRSELGGVDVVAGGLIGREGDIILDSISTPTRIIGIADGEGGITPAENSSKDVQSVLRHIAQYRLKGNP